MARPSEDPFREELAAKLQGRSPPDRRILAVGILNKHLPSGQRAVLVGGAAVEFYTTGMYVTGDVDLVGPSKTIGELLSAAGFEREGRHWWSEDLGLAIEIPDSHLRASESVLNVEYEGYRIPIVSGEDAIVDRLLASKYWRSTTDWEQAVLLWETLGPELDRSALREKAQANEVEDYVVRLLKESGKPAMGKAPGVKRKA